MTGVNVGKGVSDAALVGVAKSGPVTGIRNSAVCDAATEWVCAMAVFIKLGSGVMTAGVTQASATSSNTKTDKRMGIIFDIFPSFHQRRHYGRINYKGILDCVQWGFFLSKF